MSMFTIFSYKDLRNTNKKSTMIQTVDDFRTIITSFTDKNWNPIKSPTDKNTTCQQRLARNLWKIWKWISLSFHKWAREINDFFLGFPRLSVGFPGNIWTLLHWWHHDTDKNQNTTYRQGLERNSQNGTCDLISSVNRSDIGGRGKMFPGPGSWGPGTNKNRLFSTMDGNMEISFPVFEKIKAWIKKCLISLK